MWMVLSDLHLKEWKMFSTILANGLNSRLMQQIQVCKHVKRLIRKYKISDIFFLGDLMDSQSSTISKIIINTAFYIIQDWAELANVYLLVGNHDIYNNLNVLTPFSSIPNVWIVNVSTPINLDGKTIDLVPWNGQLPAKKADYLFGHFGIQGATTGNGFVIEEEVKPELLKDYKLVLCGHYHSRQQVADHAYQIGGVMNHSFADTTEDKGVFLLDLSNDKLEFIPISSPKFHTTKVAFSDQLEEFLRDYKENDYYKLIIESDSLIIPELPSNVIVEYDYEPTVDEKDMIDTSDILNLTPIIKQFIQQSNTALDKEILIKKAIQLLEI